MQSVINEIVTFFAGRSNELGDVRRRNVPCLSNQSNPRDSEGKCFARRCGRQRKTIALASRLFYLESRSNDTLKKKHTHKLFMTVRD